jgi:hypothetical protein
MRRLAVILVMCLLKPAQPQQWITTIDDGARGADAVSALAVDDSGCVYVTGEMERASSSSASTVKLSPTGEVRWQSEFDLPRFPTERRRCRGHRERQRLRRRGE